MPRLKSRISPAILIEMGWFDGTKTSTLATYSPSAMTKANSVPATAPGQAKIDEKLREYLSLKSQEFSKHVEHLEAAREIPKSVMDSSVTDFSLLNERRIEINDRIETLKKEWVDLAARAKKIQEENKEKFEQ